MSLNVVDTSYSGTYAPYVILRAMYSMDTLEKGVVYLKSGIKKIHTIDRLDIMNPLSPRQATPTDDGNNPFTLDGRTMIPQDVQAYREYNPRNLEANFMAEQLSNTILDRRIPPSLEGYMMQAFLNRSAEQFENGLWNGCEAYYGHYDDTQPQFQLQYWNGYLQMFVNDPLVNLSSISPVAITSSNIQSILDDLLFQAATKDQALIARKDTFKEMKYLISIPAWVAFLEFLSTTTVYKGIPLDSGEAKYWKGYEVVRLAGLNGIGTNTIVFCRATPDPITSNLWVGCNSMQDWDLRMERTQNNSEIFFILGKWKWCVQYGWSQEIFLYTTATAASFAPAGDTHSPE